MAAGIPLPTEVDLADGFMNYDGHQGVRAYSQIYRDGRLEAAMSDAAYPLERDQKNGVYALRDSILEKALFSLVPNYLAFCKSIEVEAAIWLFSALVGCEGVRIYTDWHDLSDHAIDRSLASSPRSRSRRWMQIQRRFCDHGAMRSGKPVEWKGHSTSMKTATGETDGGRRRPR